MLYSSTCLFNTLFINKVHLHRTNQPLCFIPSPASSIPFLSTKSTSTEQTRLHALFLHLPLQYPFYQQNPPPQNKPASMLYSSTCLFNTLFINKVHLHRTNQPPCFIPPPASSIYLFINKVHLHRTNQPPCFILPPASSISSCLPTHCFHHGSICPQNPHLISTQAPYITPIHSCLPYTALRSTKSISALEVTFSHTVTHRIQ